MFLNGAFSSTPTSIVSVTADNVPYEIGKPDLVVINPYNVTVKWPEVIYPKNGRDDVIFYQLEWWNYETSVWDALTNLARDGKVLNFTHVRGSIYTPSTTLRYRVRAQNGVGMSTAVSEELVINPDT